MLKLRNISKLSGDVIFNHISRLSFSRSSRDFVTASKHVLKDIDEKVEQTCQEVTEAAEDVKEGFNQVSKTTKDVKGKVSEAKHGLAKRARENVVDVATQKAKEQVIKKIK